jgi:hypothetical protein
MNITIRPLGRGRFAASLGQRLLCESKTPFFTSARILQTEGVPDDSPITMIHEGSSTVTMRSTVGEAAGKIVHETDSEGPKFKRYVLCGEAAAALGQQISARRLAGSALRTE